METTAKHDEKIARLSFEAVYSAYIAKIEKKGRTKKELDQVLKWLTGYDEKRLQTCIEKEADMKTFFQKVKLHPNAHLITGTICGYRIENIQNPLTKKIRYMDKLVDELAKGKTMEKILRKN